MIILRRWRSPRKVFLVTGEIKLVINTVKLNKFFAWCFISVWRFCPRLLQVLCLLIPLGTSVPRHPTNFTLSLDSQVLAWCSVSDCHTYLGFRCSKKVEKHCPMDRPFRQLSLDSSKTWSAFWATKLVTWDGADFWRGRLWHDVSSVCLPVRRLSQMYCG